MRIFQTDGLDKNVPLNVPKLMSIGFLPMGYLKDKVYVEKPATLETVSFESVNQSATVISELQSRAVTILNTYGRGEGYFAL